MSAVATEKLQSDYGSVGGRNTWEKVYIVKDAETRDDAIAAVEAVADPQITITVNSITFIMVLDTIAPEPIPNADPPTMWTATAEYVAVQFSTQPYNDGDTSYSFTFGTDKVKMYYPLQERAYPDGTPTFGVIGLSDDGTIEGVEVDNPTFRWQETHYIPDASVNATFKSNIAAVMKAPVNNAPFKSFDADEVKILGVVGSRRNRNAGWEVTFDFAESDNATDLFAGTPYATALPAVVKKGWEYIWIHYKTIQVTSTDGTKTWNIQWPDTCFVDQVYNRSDFSLLGIGT
jgi:hypothetical protein